MLAVRLITAAGVANQRRLTVDQRNGEGGGGREDGGMWGDGAGVMVMGPTPDCDTHRYSNGSMVRE